MGPGHSDVVPAVGQEVPVIAFILLICTLLVAHGVNLFGYVCLSGVKILAF